MRRLPSRRLYAALLPVVLPVLLTATLVAGCGGDQEAGREPTGPRVRIVGQNFTEADVLSELYRSLLAQAGFHATIERVGARDLYLGPLGKGEVDLAADTLSATVEALNHRANGADAAPVATADVRGAETELDTLAGDAGITPLAATKASLATVYAVTRRFAEQHQLDSLSDLGRARVPVTLGGGPDCAERADCAPGLQETYRITVSRVVPLGAGTADVKTALAAGRVQLAQVATTDPLLDSPDYVALTDDRHLLNPENIVPLANTAWLEKHQDAREAVERLSKVLTTADLRSLSAKVNVLHQSAARVAHDYLERRDLV